MGEGKRLVGSDFWLASLGVGLCIASTEVQRYTVLWPVGTGFSGGHYTDMLVFLTLGFALVAAAGRLVGRRRGFPSARLILAVMVAVASAAGVLVRSLLVTGTLPADSLLWETVRFAMEAPYLLMVLWAGCLLGFEGRAAMRAVALGIVLAGVIQIAVSLISGNIVSYAIAFALAPSAAALLLRLDRSLPRPPSKPQDSCPGWEPETPPTAGAASATAPLAVTGALIVLSSMVVYVIHSQWTGIQDGGPASLLVQICTGLGVVLAGVLLYVAAGRLVGQSLFDFCFMLVLPVAVAGLYLSHAGDDAALVASVIPLNIVYATLLFFVWCIPFICAARIRPQALSLLAFYLKRAGVLVCPLVMAVFAALGVSLTWLTFGAITALVALYAAHFLLVHRDAEGSALSARSGVGDAYALACAAVARMYGLTPRESDTLALLGRGRTARHIAGQLGMSDATVKTHTAHIYRKLGVNSQQQLLDIVEEAVRAQGPMGRGCTPSA